MGTIRDLPGWGNANFWEIHLLKGSYRVVNSEQRSATEFTTRSVAEGECIASQKGEISWQFSKVERNPENLFVIG